MREIYWNTALYLNTSMSKDEFILIPLKKKEKNPENPSKLVFLPFLPISVNTAPLTSCLSKKSKHHTPVSPHLPHH